MKLIVAGNRDEYLRHVQEHQLNPREAIYYLPG